MNDAESVDDNSLVGFLLASAWHHIVNMILQAHWYGIYFVHYLQSWKRAAWLAEALTLTTADPLLWLTYILPLSFLFGFRTQWRLLVAIAFAQICGIILSGAIRAERPYWFVGEHADVSHKTDVAQFASTCAKTHGLPSPELLVFVGASTVLTQFLCACLKQRVVRIVLKLFNFILSILICLACVYTGLLFLHQCVITLILGTIGGRLAFAIPWERTHWHHYAAAIFFFTCWFVSSRFTLLSLGQDPNLSLNLATKFCQHPEWLRHFLPPVGIMWLNMGILAGLASIADCSWIRAVRQARWNILSRIVVAGSSLAFSWFMESLLPKSPSTCSLLLFAHGALLVLVEMALIPRATFAYLTIHNSSDHFKQTQKLVRKVTKSQL